MFVRAATLEDGPACIEVRRRSITDLCFPDHGGDQATIDDWLGTPTMDDFRSWLSGGPTSIAEIDQEVAGFASVHFEDEATAFIRLLYVHPTYQHCGVSRALLARMETDAQLAGSSRIILESTKTAERFYQARGYQSWPTERSGIWFQKDLST